MVINRPGKYPNLNPIENIGNFMMGKMIKLHLDKLIKGLKIQGPTSITKDYCNGLWNFMLRRIQQVLDTMEETTKYKKSV
jgi:hypothetical protein